MCDYIVVRVHYLKQFVWGLSLAQMIGSSPFAREASGAKLFVRSEGICC